MIHLESLIQSQKMSFFKRYLDPEYVADWKIVVDSLLTLVGGPYLLKCNFHLCDLPVKVSPFYEECLTLCVPSGHIWPLKYRPHSGGLKRAL